MPESCPITSGPSTFQQRRGKEEDERIATHHDIVHTHLISLNIRILPIVAERPDAINMLCPRACVPNLPAPDPRGFYPPIHVPVHAPYRGCQI